MKVLQIINSLSTGGAEKLVADSVPLFQQRNILTDVLVLKNVKTPFWLQLQQKSKDSIMGLTTSSVYNPLLIFKIIPYLKNYDVIHAHLFPTLYWVVLAKYLSRSKTPIVYTEHNTNNNRRHHFLLKRIDRLIYKEISKIVTIADEVDVNTKEHLPDIEESKFVLINNGVNLEAFANATPADKSNWFTSDSQIIVQVSSFREQKDQPTLIKAMAQLPDQFKLLLVGDGPLRASCEGIAKQLGLSDRIQFLGLREDIPQILKMADYIVLSSYYEGLSLSSIEGMAAHKPFLASDVPGLREIVRNFGVLFPQGDSAVLAKEILSLSQDPEQYNKVAEQCFLRSQQFDIDNMIENYLKVYEEFTY